MRVQANSYPQGVSRYYISIYNISSQLRYKTLSFAAQGFDVAEVQPASVLARLIKDDGAKWLAIIKHSGAWVD
jgi:hypothetical protein